MIFFQMNKTIVISNLGISGVLCFVYVKVKSMGTEGKRGTWIQSGKLFKIVDQNTQHIHADQKDSNIQISKLTWYGLPYRDELTQAKSERHYRSKVEMMSKFMRKIP